MGRDTQLTPMMAQYRQLKGEVPSDALLLFRLGDFYELFFEDAEEGAHLLNIALTKRGDAPMCGIPYHNAESYIARILKAGRKVAISEQAEEARPGHLVRREITQILSPGTHFDDRLLEAEKNNYLAGLAAHGQSIGLAIIDLTTGDFRTGEFNDETAVRAELERLRPAELIFPAGTTRLEALAQSLPGRAGPYEEWAFARETAQSTLLEHFQVATLDGFGLKNCPLAVTAAGGVLHYLLHHLRRDVRHITRITSYEETETLRLDTTSLRNLEILEPMRADAPHSISLYRVINTTVTPMGARCLRDWITRPLGSAPEIRARQEAVSSWLETPDQLDAIRHQLTEVKDLERILSRLSTGSGNARDLVALRNSLRKLPALRGTVQETLARPSGKKGTDAPSLGFDGAAETDREGNTPENRLQPLEQSIAELPETVDLLERALVDEPPATLKEGGMIREGYDSALDELRSAAGEGKSWIASLQQKEIERTQIPSLKIRYNQVFGYYIEVTKANLDKVPADYIRKQTIANGERFFTPELKEVEGKILGSQERAVKLEHEIFLTLRDQVLAHLTTIQQTARALAQLDVLASFAETARLQGYCRPEIGNEGVLKIRDGRHPVLDQPGHAQQFVPNDSDLDPGENQVALITGPNMAGKSTYIRQVALLTLMAHTGSYVPATSARIDLVDRIFTRIGASDDLAQGHSTFMVEMSETANLLNNATPRSLIVVDEIGRGTSTFDGLSLAWSIAEHLHQAVGAKTLFATHYHELTGLADRLPRIRNYNVAVREWNEQIIFLHKIVPGASDKSYGIQVARLAGLPKPVLNRAKEILNNLEASELKPDGTPHASGRPRSQRQRLKDLPPSPQLDLFADGQ